MFLFFVMVKFDVCQMKEAKKNDCEFEHEGEEKLWVNKPRFRKQNRPKEMVWSYGVKQENLRINKETLTEATKGEKLGKQSYVNIVRHTKGTSRINTTKRVTLSTNGKESINDILRVKIDENLYEVRVMEEGMVDGREKEEGNGKSLYSDSNSYNEEEDSMEME
ncbi:hypothetical protein VNO78_16946 [Psophocarpus tetragonolobus]|uniref:Uncharacterized protein n=1 Tax=Psophocarpus tetragonolobus TaxID=3891 RepID=A0AAN9XKF3_PSOTE